MDLAVGTPITIIDKKHEHYQQVFVILFHQSGDFYGYGKDKNQAIATGRINKNQIEVIK